MLTPEVYPFQHSLALFIQLQKEIMEFVSLSNIASSSVSQRTYSMFCSGDNYKTSELHLGLRKSLYNDHSLPCFGYFE